MDKKLIEDFNHSPEIKHLVRIMNPRTERVNTFDPTEIYLAEKGCNLRFPGIGFLDAYLIKNPRIPLTKELIQAYKFTGKYSIN